MAALLPTIYFARRPLTRLALDPANYLSGTSRDFDLRDCDVTRCRPGPIQTRHAIGLLSPLTLLQELLVALLFHAAPTLIFPFPRSICRIILLKHRLSTLLFRRHSFLAFLRLQVHL